MWEEEGESSVDRVARTKWAWTWGRAVAVCQAGEGMGPRQQCIQGGRDPRRGSSRVTWVLRVGILDDSCLNGDQQSQIGTVATNYIWPLKTNILKMYKIQIFSLTSQSSRRAATPFFCYDRRYYCTTQV